MAGEFSTPDGSEFVAPTSDSAESIGSKIKARETMTAAMQNIDRVIAGIQPKPGESPEDLLLRVRSEVHNAAFEEVNKS